LGALSKIFALFNVVRGFFQVLGHVVKNRPQVIVSAGGFVSVPVILAGSFFRIPVFLLEPNIRAGFSNRVLSRLARLCFSVPGSDALTKMACEVKDWGIPLREGLPRYEARASRRVLILGGSQGAKTLCDWMCQIWSQPETLNLADLWQLQCGKSNIESVQKRLEPLGILGRKVHLHDFIDDVPQALGGADFVIARAGALTIAELAVVGVPTLFVPFPFAADNHQQVNAEMLVNAGAARMALERGESPFETFKAELTDFLLMKEQEKEKQSLSFTNWGRPNAGPRIAEFILSSLGNTG
jgi:UDP-N-acetylglucosamine--N-acetylmuramyl-(pentapeptide) pyrophosphoryl-undecaprenol N-acetylglucosamine transferase